MTPFFAIVPVIAIYKSVYTEKTAKDVKCIPRIENIHTGYTAKEAEAPGAHAAGQILHHIGNQIKKTILKKAFIESIISLRNVYMT
jgi:hypothetical protein